MMKNINQPKKRPGNKCFINLSIKNSNNNSLIDYSKNNYKSSSHKRNASVISDNLLLDCSIKIRSSSHKKHSKVITDNLLLNCSIRNNRSSSHKRNTTAISESSLFSIKLEKSPTKRNKILLNNLNLKHNVFKNSLRNIENIKDDYSNLNINKEITKKNLNNKNNDINVSLSISLNNSKNHFNTNMKNITIQNQRQKNKKSNILFLEINKRFHSSMNSFVNPQLKQKYSMKKPKISLSKNYLKNTNNNLNESDINNKNNININLILKDRFKNSNKNKTNEYFIRNKQNKSSIFNHKENFTKSLKTININKNIIKNNISESSRNKRKKNKSRNII